MNWLKNFVPPKLRKLVEGQKELPENLWHNCPSCNQMIFHRDLSESQSVCQHCGHHLRMKSANRLKMLFNDGNYAELSLTLPAADPLKFRDIKKYTDRIKDAQITDNKKDALTVATGEIGDHKVVIAVFDFSFMGGSMGIAVGDGILAASRNAIKEKCPLIVITSSGGARMQEGALSLMQLARTTIGINKVKDSGLPYIVVLADPTTGGVSASIAMLGDILIAEKGAVIGFAGSRVIEQTIRETLPKNFQKAESLLKHGMLDMVVHRHDLRQTLDRLISILVDPSGLRKRQLKGNNPNISEPKPTNSLKDTLSSSIS